MDLDKTNRWLTLTTNLGVIGGSYGVLGGNISPKPEASHAADHQRSLTLVRGRISIMTETEKIIEEIESSRSAEFGRELEKRGTLIEKLEIGYSHAENRIVQYNKWKELEKDLKSKDIDYKTDSFLNPLLSYEEILFFRYMFDDELIRKVGVWPGDIDSAFNNDTYIYNYCREYRRILKKGNRWNEVLAAQKIEGGNYISVASRIIRIIFVVGLIGWIGMIIIDFFGLA